MVLIRPERPGDETAVFHVLAQAFGRTAESELVDHLRTQGAFVMALVAEVEGQVVGHVLFTAVTLAAETSSQAVALGPVGVLPAWQQQGIGGQLIQAGLQQCGVMGHTLVFVLGHPTYYPRFGFTPTRPYGIFCVYPVPDDVFMLIELQPGAINGRTGIVKYHPAFDGV